MNRLVSALHLATLLAVSVAAGCAAGGPTGSMAPYPATEPAQVRYDCGNGGALVIKAINGGLELSQTDEDESVTLQPSPPGQSSRYDANGHALVLNGDEALWMKSGKVPLTCRR